MLVSQGDGMVAAVNGQGVAVGQRVVTTAGAGATVSYDAGCNVVLGENRGFTVRALGECGALIASVETLGPAAGAIGGGGGAVAATGIGTGGFIAVGAIAGIAIYETAKNDKKSKSPN